MMLFLDFKKSLNNKANIIDKKIVPIITFEQINLTSKTIDFPERIDIKESPVNQFRQRMIRNEIKIEN